MAPIITAGEFIFSPMEAMNMARIMIHMFVPLNCPPLVIRSLISSGVAQSVFRLKVSISMLLILSIFTVIGRMLNLSLTATFLILIYPILNFLLFKLIKNVLYLLVSVYKKRRKVSWVQAFSCIVMNLLISLYIFSLQAQASKKCQREVYCYTVKGHFKGYGYKTLSISFPRL